MCVCLVAQLCLTLYNPMDCRPPGSSVHGESSRQEYWSGLPCPPSGDLSSQVSCIAGRFLTVWAALSKFQEYLHGIQLYLLLSITIFYIVLPSQLASKLPTEQQLIHMLPHSIFHNIWHNSLHKVGNKPVFVSNLIEENFFTTSLRTFLKRNDVFSLIAKWYIPYIQCIISLVTLFCAKVPVIYPANFATSMWMLTQFLKNGK